MNPVAPALVRFPLRRLLLLAFASSLAVAVRAQTLPAPVGHVNDFAGVLPKPAAAELEASIVAFEHTAPVRIVVVTIDSLGGRSVEVYAADLGKAWRIGDVGKDNGVVFLVAVRDHRLRIQTARAARKVISDAAANHIRDVVVLPRFRRGDMAAGIIEGTRLLMQTALPPPVVVETPQQIAARQQQLVARVEAERQHRAQVAAAMARREAMVRTALLALGGVAVGVALLAAGNFLFLRPIRNRRRVLAGKDALSAHLRQVETLVKHPDAKPELASRLAGLKKEAAFLADLRPNVTADWNRAGRRFDDLRQAVLALESAARMQIDYAAEARRRGPKLLQNLPGIIAATEEQLAKPNVSPEAKRRLESARQSFQRAQTLQSGTTATDWVLLYALLNESNTSCTDALGVQHQHEIALSQPPPPSPSSVDFGGGGGGFDSSSGGGGSSGSW